MQRRYLGQIDLLKALGILGVMVQHALPGRDLSRVWATLHVAQAVPIFFVLLGANAAAAARRRGGHRLRELYTVEWFAGRVDRYVTPFVVVWVLAAIVALAEGVFHVGPLTLVGVLPLDGPGNYFVTIVFEFALVFPLLWACFARAPAPTILACFALDAAFEVLSPHVASFTSQVHPYLYEASILRYLAAIALGMWLAQDLPGRAGRYAWLVPAAAVSVAYLVTEHLQPDDYDVFLPSFGKTTNVVSVFYALALVVVGMRLLPERPRGVASRALVAVGRASYHVFLVQIVYFGVVADRSPRLLAVHLLVNCVLGVALERALRPVPRLQAWVEERRRREPARPLPRAETATPGGR